MAYFSSSQLLIFNLKFTIPNHEALLSQIERRFSTIVDSYDLRPEESVLNPWILKIRPRRSRGGRNLLLMKLDIDSAASSAITEIIPSLLIYLKIFNEISTKEEMITVYSGQLEYRQLQMTGVLTIPIESLDTITVTNISARNRVWQEIFTIDDLDERLFVVDSYSRSEAELTELHHWLEEHITVLSNSKE